MNRLPVSALLALGALLGCTERYSGGFETSDLQATVVRPTGTPVAAARVWLVKATNDSMPAAALDSTLTDSTGTARFTVVRGVDRKGLGLDAQIGDSLGISIRSLERSDLATIQLVPAFRLQVGGDSIPVDTLHTIGLHIPGSHFASRSTGGTASLLVPQGTWDIAIRQGSSIEFKDSLAITKDSALPLVAPLDTTRPADTAKPIDTLPEPIDTLRPGPDISLDSFAYQGRAFRKAPSPTWTPMSFNSCDTLECITRTTGSLASSYPEGLAISSFQSSDTESLVKSHAGYGGASAILYDSSFLALQLQPLVDSATLRIWVGDTAGTGLLVLYDSASNGGLRRVLVMASLNDSTWILGDHSDTSLFPSTWYFHLAGDSIHVQSGGTGWSSPFRRWIPGPIEARITFHSIVPWRPKSLVFGKIRTYH